MRLKCFFFSQKFNSLMRAIEQAIHEAARFVTGNPPPPDGFTNAEMDERELAKALIDAFKKALIDAFKEIDSRLIAIEIALRRMQGLP